MDTYRGITYPQYPRIVVSLARYIEWESRFGFFWLFRTDGSRSGRG